MIDQEADINYSDWLIITALFPALIWLVLTVAKQQDQLRLCRDRLHNYQGIVMALPADLRKNNGLKISRPVKSEKYLLDESEKQLTEAIEILREATK